MKNILLPAAAAMLLATPLNAQVRIHPEQQPASPSAMFYEGMFGDPFAPFDAFFEPVPFAPSPVGFAERPHRQHSYPHPASYPRMDVAAIGDKIEIRAELPGMDEKDISLSLDNNILTLQGEHKQEQQEENKNYYLKEIAAGYFKKSVRLPPDIDGKKIDAVFKNGILTVTIPRLPDKDNTVKKIPVRKE